MANHKRKIQLFPTCGFLALLLGMLVATATRAQTSPSGPSTYNHNASEFQLDTRNMPADVQGGYRLFRTKCGECHSRNRLLGKSDMSREEWTDIVFRMRDMASSHIDTKQAKAILDFVIWNDQQSKRNGLQNENH